jgi:hypothetical protein
MSMPATVILLENTRHSFMLVVKESKLEGFPKTISLMMSVLGQGQRDQETAKRIFCTIRFENAPE